MPQLSATLVRVRRGEELYLVPEDRMIEFCNAWSTNARSLDTRFARRDFARNAHDPRRSDEPPPVVPEEYRKYLLVEPIRCTVVAREPALEVGPPVNGKRRFACGVEVDAGSEAGLLMGMSLYHTNQFDVGDVVEVRARSARVVFLMSESLPEKIRPQIGWQLSTMVPERR
jgi:hypothetical protein